MEEALKANYRSLIRQLTNIKHDIELQNLPAPSDARLMKAEIEAIDTINALLNNCIENITFDPLDE